MTLKSPTVKPTAAEFGLLRAFLARAGASQAQIEQAIGTAANGRTRAQISTALQVWIALNGFATGLRPTKG